MAQARVEPSPDSNIEVIGRIILVPVGQVTPMEGQPRLIFDKLEMKLMVASLQESGQIIPALLVEVSGRPGITHQIVDGERRYRGVIAAGMPKLKGIVYDGLNADDARRLYRTSVVANFGRVEHQPLERALAAKSFMDDLGISVAEVARQFSKNPETIERDLRLLKLDSRVHELMLKGLPGKSPLGTGIASNLYAYPGDFQAMVAREIVELGIDSHKAAYHVRRRVAEEGVARLTGTRGKNPSDTAGLFLQGLLTFDGRLRRMASVDDISLPTVFGSMKPPNRAKLVSAVASIEQNLAKIRDALKETE